MNEQIRKTPVRVIAADGSQLGIIPTTQALDVAREAGLDLVEVAPEARPPVCRIMDFGKFKYQRGKQKQKNTSHKSKSKEIRLRPRTGDHDIDVKVNRAKEFLTHKDKVLVTLIFRGREGVHEEEGRRVINLVIKQLEDIAKVEQSPSRQGRRMTCVLAPRA
ncbi:MAG: translation initiation factor IF-3 [Planctomycetales bacterium]